MQPVQRDPRNESLVSYPDTRVGGKTRTKKAAAATPTPIATTEAIVAAIEGSVSRKVVYIYSASVGTTDVIEGGVGLSFCKWRG